MVARVGEGGGARVGGGGRGGVRKVQYMTWTKYVISNFTKLFPGFLEKAAIFYFY